ncbi:hypothetical protein HAX54_044195, partial [Datura stramonium]|nr:hypothetical protein [Datura stramonium]
LMSLVQTHIDSLALSVSYGLLLDQKLVNVLVYNDYQDLGVFPLRIVIGSFYYGDFPFIILIMCFIPINCRITAKEVPLQRYPYRPSKTVAANQKLLQRGPIQ